MKKILLLALSLIFMISCGGSKQKTNENEKAEAYEFIKSEVESVDKILRGKQIDFMTVCDSAIFVNGDIHYYYTIDEGYTSIEAVRDNVNEVKNNQKTMMESVPAGKELVSKLEMINASLTYHYRGSLTGEELSITVYDF